MEPPSKGVLVRSLIGKGMWLNTGHVLRLREDPNTGSTLVVMTDCEFPVQGKLYEIAKAFGWI